MKNKKGFTLVELLAVVTIISILAMLAIPNVTRYVEQSRKKTFVEDAKTIVSTAKSNYASGSYELTNGIDSSKKNKVIYSKVAIDSILSSKLGKSSFNSDYKDAGVIISKTTDEYGATRYNYYVCLIDKAGNGFDYTSDKDLNTNSLSFDQETTNCTGLPRISYTVNVVVNNGSVNESEKKVYEDEDTSFDLTPNTSGMESTVSCTNNQKGILNHNTLTVKGVTASTTCTVTFSQSMTVLYNDGTLIINEKPSDRNSNISKHGEVAKEYAAMSNSNQYVFASEEQQLWYQEKTNILRIEIGQAINPNSMAFWFNGLTNMSYGDFTNLDTSNVESLYMTFYHAGFDSSNFKLIGLDNWDTSKVTTMKYMFSAVGYNAPTWSIGDLSSWNTSKVTNMSYMFENAGQNAPTWSIGNLSNWDTSKVRYLEFMFSRAGFSASLFNLGNISNWNVSNVDTMQYMFSAAGYSATSWNIGDLSNWDTSNVTLMTSVFSGAGYSATSWSIGDLSNWNISKVTSINSMFSRSGYNSTAWNIGNISNWDTSNVTDMSYIFHQAGYSAKTWNIGNISNWNTSKVINMRNMFFQAGYNATIWNIGNLSNWDTSKVINMRNMFSQAGYSATAWNVGTLSSWNTSNVIDMSGMFFQAGYSASQFKLNVSSWNTSKVTNMSYMFANSGFFKAKSWDIGKLDNWDTRNVKNMQSMFGNVACYSNDVMNIGTLNIYATNIVHILYQGFRMNVVLNIYSNPTSYSNALYQAAEKSGGLVTVNYSKNTTNIDEIIATKIAGSNVVKGVQLD